MGSCRSAGSGASKPPHHHTEPAAISPGGPFETNRMPLFRLSDAIVFPPPGLATPEGLLAIGGDLRRRRLLAAYEWGIFPWYAEGQPIMWWSPDPRLVLYPREIRISKSLRKVIRRGTFKITIDRAFHEVIRGCATAKRAGGEGTWLVPEMIDAYCDLHEAGLAHSVEAWHGDSLAGGLYGVSLGRCFFGESMFTVMSNASKVAFAALAAFLADREFGLIDCQVPTDHLVSFGAREISRRDFLLALKELIRQPALDGKWCPDS